MKLEQGDIVMNREKYGVWSKVRCFLGLHYWHEVGFGNLLNPCPVERCKRCGVGRHFQIAAGCYAYYSKEEMDTAIQGSKRGED